MDLLNKIKNNKPKIGVIGLGYVGLPLVIEFCKAGVDVTGFDVDKMDIDILEVIEAVKTKPFGSQAFYPSPGLGGICIPIVLLLTDHSAYNYQFIAQHAACIIDARNAFHKSGIINREILKA